MKWNPLDFMSQEIAELPSVRHRHTLKHECVKRGFLGRAAYAIGLIFKEKEIIAFSSLQAVVIGLGYYVWVQILGWIPDEVWKSASRSDSASLADVVVWAWSFLIVGIVAFPVGMLSACTAAAHFLHRAGKPSTVVGCLHIVFSRMWMIWLLHWADGWITVMQILRRLPRKNDRRTPQQIAMSETLYYAWKLGTMGVLPAILTGTGFKDSGKKAILVVKTKAADLIKLRLGYSSICWIIGIAAYLGAIVLIGLFDPLPQLPVHSKMYELYLLVGVSMVIAVSIIQVFLRPIYLISLCDIYSDYLKEQGEEAHLPSTPSLGVGAMIVFILLGLWAAFIIVYRHELGIMNILTTLYR